MMRLRNIVSAENLATINLINCFLGYWAVVGLFGWISESAMGSWIVSVPYRAISLLLNTIVIWQNRHHVPAWHTGIVCLWVYMFILVVRLIIDLSGNEWVLTSDDVRIILLLCVSNIAAIISVFLSFERVKLQECNRWCFIVAMIACVAITIVNFTAITDWAILRVGVNGLYPISLGHLGGALVLLSVLTYISDESDTRFKSIAFIGVMLGLFIIVRAASRGPFFITLLLVALLLWRKYKWVGVISCVLLGTIIATTELWLSDTENGLSGRILKTIYSMDNPRLQIWRDACGYIAQHFLWGGKFCWYGESGYWYAHNILLDAMIAGGIFGLVLLIIPLWYNVKYSIVLFRHDAMLPLLFLSAQNVLESMVSGAFYSNLGISVSMCVIILLYVRGHSDCKYTYNVHKSI